ncbi:hypothetical protein TSUD_163250 [Trifolium subterraneum]|uniref:Uncharacterized protein n=1 Tax=Trifolium subterraneum TaxID=3900 RepID=A0A2Z6NW26_TRISU|nr:hypothetical protein TSUD_163250 [Trifolium subterraneum]
MKAKRKEFVMLWVENGRDTTGTSFEDPEEDPTQQSVFMRVRVSGFGGRGLPFGSHRELVLLSRMYMFEDWVPLNSN